MRDCFLNLLLKYRIAEVATYRCPEKTRRTMKLEWSVWCRLPQDGNKFLRRQSETMEHKHKILGSPFELCKAVGMHQLQEMSGSNHSTPHAVTSNCHQPAKQWYTAVTAGPNCKVHRRLHKIGWPKTWPPACKNPRIKSSARLGAWCACHVKLIMTQ